MYRSYVRRKRFEARLIANEILEGLGKAFGGSTSTPEPGPTSKEPRKKVPPDKKIMSTGADKKGRTKIPASAFFDLVGADE